MVGAQTAQLDNPRLTARLWPGKQPLRIVLDRKLELPHTHHVFDNAAATWIINERQEILEGNVHAIQLKFDDTLLRQLLHKLYETRILSVIIEGGASLLKSFIEASLWDEARVFTGSQALNDGVSAPDLINSNTAFDMQVGPDRLAVFVNRNSDYPYVNGMEL